jgi:hypothetical protein
MLVLAMHVTRDTVLSAYKDHAILGKLYKRLKAEDITALNSFLKANAHLDKGSFERAVNRMFIDRPKPKHWKEIIELLSCANSAL